MGKQGALSFPTAFERGDIIAICCYWQHFDLRQGRQDAHANLLYRYPSLAVQRWELEPGHQCPGGAGQVLCSKSHAGVQLLPAGSLGAETAVVEDAAQAWPPNLQAHGGHNPSSLTCCRDWSSSGHFRNPAAAIWHNLHRQERCMYGWLQAQGAAEQTHFTCQLWNWSLLLYLF